MTDAVYPGKTSAIYALILFTLASFFSLLDRQILALLVPDIQRDLGITDTQMSIAQGFAFTVFYSCMGMPLGWLADRANRRNLIAAGIALWSVATIFCGLANSYNELLFARLALGVGEAALSPAALSLLADYFRPEARGRAFSIFNLAVFAGAGAALMGGGAILAAFRDTPTVVLPVFGEQAIWKAVFIIVGLPGIVIAVLMLSVREVPRRSEIVQAGARSLFSYARRHRAAFACVLISFTLVAYVTYGLLPWGPTFLFRKFGLAMSQAGLMSGAAAAGGGVIGSIVSGVIGDRWTMRRARGGKFRLTMLYWILALPGILLFALAATPFIAVLGYGFYFFANGLAFSSATAALQDMVPAHLRGRASASWYFVTAFGIGFGPLVTALCTDYVFKNPAALGYSFILMAVPAVCTGFVLTAFGTRHYDAARRSLPN